MSSWAKIRFCSRQCATHWQHYGKPKNEVEEVKSKECLYCNTVMTRKEDEHMQAWLKRKYCNKSHASLGKDKSKGRLARTPTAPIHEQKAGLVHYTPGSPEFNKLAEQYSTKG
jgi:hypothetical protein